MKTSPNIFKEKIGFKLALCLVLFTFAWQCTLDAKEPINSMRKAYRLYDKGFYQSAAAEAEHFLVYFPDDFDALLLAGMSRYHKGDYIESIDHFIQADRISPNHAVVERYLKMLRELEYRSEPFSDELQKISHDPMKTAEYYKQNYWRSIPPETSKEDKRKQSLSTLDPHLMTYVSESRGVDLVTALPAEPPVKSLTSDEIIESLAKKAMEAGKPIKAYLFYTQLYTAHPDQERFLLARAEAAYSLKRFTQVLKLLTPAFITGAADKWDTEVRLRAQQLTEDARTFVYNSPSN